MASMVEDLSPGPPDSKSSALKASVTLPPSESYKYIEVRLSLRAKTRNVIALYIHLSEECRNVTLIANQQNIVNRENATKFICQYTV